MPEDREGKTPQPSGGPAEHFKAGKISRRQLLKWTGAGVVAATLAKIIPMAKVALGSGSKQESNGARRLRRWAMVIDLRNCDGCVGLGIPPQCTQACIMGHYVPEGQEWIEVFQQELPGDGTQFVPAPCMHCQNAPCVNVCPVAATFATPEGVVLVDQERCIGCRLCMAACPYSRRFFNWGDPVQPPQAMFAEYSPETQYPASRGTTMKCNLCPHRARMGQLPFCAAACPRKCIYFGDLETDLATNGVKVVKLSDFLAENAAYRLKEELGTKPRVFYIPGHGQLVGRSARDTRRRLPVQWPWAKEQS